MCTNSVSTSYFDLNTGLCFGQVKCHRIFLFGLNLMKFG